MSALSLSVLIAASAERLKQARVVSSVSPIHGFGFAEFALVSTAVCDLMGTMIGCAERSTVE